MSEMAIPKDKFLGDIREIINSARVLAVKSVDFCRVQMYWQLGKRIFEEEQQGKERADYGTYLIKNLLNNWSRNTGVAFPCVNWNAAGSSTGSIRLRPHCGRN